MIEVLKYHIKQIDQF